eukprot:m.32870 g.32870  ORF g.32870 m.32870 type:complete len:53 (-) comp16716_c0_seq2:922-1080(-)
MMITTCQGYTHCPDLEKASVATSKRLKLDATMSCKTRVGSPIVTTSSAMDGV